MKKKISLILQGKWKEMLFSFFSLNSIVWGIVLTIIIFSYINWSSFKKVYHSIITISEINESVKDVKDTQEILIKNDENQDSLIINISRKQNKADYESKHHKRKAEAERKNMYKYIEIIARKTEVSEEIIEFYKERAKENVIENSDEISDNAGNGYSIEYDEVLFVDNDTTKLILENYKIKKKNNIFKRLFTKKNKR